MHLLVEEVTVVGQPVERHPHQRPLGRVGRGRQVGGHQAPRFTLRLRVTGEVHQRDLDTAVRADPLVGDSVALTEGQPHRLRLVGDVPDGFPEEHGIDPAGDGRVLRHVVRRIARVEFLREPEPPLSGSQRKDNSAAAVGTAVVDLCMGHAQLTSGWGDAGRPTRAYKCRLRRGNRR